MVLTKDDLKQIRTVVKDEISGAKEEIKDFVNKEVEKGVDSLAVMVKHGFDANDIHFKAIKRDLAVHDFKMTEMVHKSDYYKLEERVEMLEKREGIKHR